MSKHIEYIYTLTDPRDETVRYVGRTNQPQNRMHSHMNGDVSNQEKSAWIGELKDLNLSPIMTVIETIPYDIPCHLPDLERPGQREIHWIHHYRALGAPLFNKTTKKYVVQYPVTFDLKAKPQHNLSLKEENERLRKENAKLREIIKNIQQLAELPPE